MVEENNTSDKKSEEKPIVKVKPSKKIKLKPMKLGDTVKFFDELNREFRGIVENTRGVTCDIKVSRLRGHSQLYVKVPQSTNKRIKPRFN